MSYRLAKLAEKVGARLVGDPEILIDSVCTLRTARAGSISFLSNYLYKRHLMDTKASAVILSADALADCPVAALVTDNPYLAYARIVDLLNPRSERAQAGVDDLIVYDRLRSGPGLRGGGNP